MRFQNHVEFPYHSYSNINSKWKCSISIQNASTEQKLKALSNKPVHTTDKNFHINKVSFINTFLVKCTSNLWIPHLLKSRILNCSHKVIERNQNYNDTGHFLMFYYEEHGKWVNSMANHCHRLTTYYLPDSSRALWHSTVIISLRNKYSYLHYASN